MENEQISSYNSIEAKKIQARQLVERGYSLESTAHILALQVESLKKWMGESASKVAPRIKFGRSI